MAYTAERPSRAAARSGAEKFGVGEKRLHADIPADLHQKVKARCFKRGIQIREYLLELLAKDGLTPGKAGAAVPRSPRTRAAE